MRYCPLPDPEDPDWAEIMYELSQKLDHPLLETNFVIDLTRKGCGICGYRQVDNG